MPKTNVKINTPQFWSQVKKILDSGDSVEIKPGPHKTIKVIHKRRGTVIGDTKIEDIACP